MSERLEMQQPIAVMVRNVTQSFRVIHERPDTVREVFARFFQSRTSYHEFLAIRDVSFALERGKMLGVLGRNGSGKSTLLKVIAGVYRPTSGSVELHGSVAPLLELGAGMQPELTGRQNIILNGLLLGYSKREMRMREPAIIDFADIGDFIDAPVKQYSSGMYMRLAFSIATEVDPDILIVDEILAVGDFAFSQKCLSRLEQFRQAGKTILFVTHSLQQVMDYCDRAIVLNAGCVAFDGHTDEAIEFYRSISTPAEAAEAAVTHIL
jgi:ABC-type polysaccharide/polyol phosphate transport system ATPase subunit